MQTKIWLCEIPTCRTTKRASHGTKVWVYPKPDPNDLLFASYHTDGKQPQPRSLYARLAVQFKNLLESINMGTWEENG